MKKEGLGEWLGIQEGWGPREEAVVVRGKAAKDWVPEDMEGMREESQGSLGCGAAPQTEPGTKKESHPVQSPDRSRLRGLCSGGTKSPGVYFLWSCGARFLPTSMFSQR